MEGESSGGLLAGLVSLPCLLSFGSGCEFGAHRFDSWKSGCKQFCDFFLFFAVAAAVFAVLLIVIDGSLHVGLTYAACAHFGRWGSILVRALRANGGTRTPVFWPSGAQSAPKIAEAAYFARAALGKTSSAISTAILSAIFGADFSKVSRFREIEFLLILGHFLFLTSVTPTVKVWPKVKGGERILDLAM